MSAIENQDDKPIENEQAEVASEAVEPRRPEIRETLDLAMAEIRTSFTSCGLCSLFLASTLLNTSKHEFEEAILNIEDGWIKLPWDRAMRESVNKCFGFLVDTEVYHFEGCCPECSRLYQYDNPDTEQSPKFLIKGKK